MAKNPSWLKDLSPADRKLAKGLLSGRYADIDENGNIRNKKAVEKFQRTYRGNVPNAGKNKSIGRSPTSSTKTSAKS